MLSATKPQRIMEGAPQNPEEKLAYSTAAVQGIKEQIITSIKDHKSPVGIMMNGHYVTIIGIEGDTISYYNSMPTELSGNNPEYIYQENLGTFLDKALNGENASYITLTWSEDIKLSKDGKYIYGTSLPNLSVDASGRVITNAKESQAMFLDDRHHYDVDQLSRFEDERLAAFDENEVTEFSKKERKIADDRMYKTMKAVLIGKQKMITAEKEEIAKDKEKLAGGLSLLQGDLKKGKHHYDDITFAKNPKIDYRSAADIIVRARAKRPVLINLDHTDWQFGDRNNDLRFKASEIANSLNFYMYIQENRELIPTLTIEEYVKGYEDFNKAALEADSKTAVTDTTFKMNEYEVFNQQNIQKGN